MEGGPQKRKPEVQLTKDQALEDARNGSSSLGPSESEELKMADPEVLKKRTRMKIIRSNQPAAQMDLSEEKKKQPSSDVSREEEENCSTKEQTTVSETGGDASLVDGSTGKTDTATADEPCKIKDTDTKEGEPPSQKNDENGKVGEPNASSTAKPDASKLSLFSGELKGSASFVSPFSSLPSSGTSFFLNPSSGSLFPSSRPGGSGVNGAEGSADADDADVPPPEELTLVATAVDEGESVLFSDDCRMQLFDVESKAWGPRPPLDGKVELVEPKDAEAASYTARILFFVNRTGRLRLNTPVLPSSMPFKHPVDRAAAAAVAKADEKEKASDNGDGIPKEKEIPVKLNTVDFIGLKIDAANAKDTTLYRIRFSNNDKAKEFLTLANQKQEEAKKGS